MNKLIQTCNYSNDFLLLSSVLLNFNFRSSQYVIFYPIICDDILLVTLTLKLRHKFFNRLLHREPVLLHREVGILLIQRNPLFVQIF